MTAVLEATGLGKRYRRTWALRDCSVAVPEGRVVALVGPNGAGKSTLLHLAVGLLGPSAGYVRVFGAPAASGPETLSRVGFLAQDKPLYPRFSVADTVRFCRELNPGFDEPFARDRLRRLGIDTGQRVGRLSGGQRQSVSIARAMKDGVKLVILDEPTAALGIAQTRNVLRIARQAADNGAGVILISHDIRTVFAVADRVVVLRLGRVVFDDTIDNVTHTRLLHLMAGLEDVRAADGPAGDEARLDEAERSAVAPTGKGG